MLPISTAMTKMQVMGHNEGKTAAGGSTEWSRDKNADKPATFTVWQKSSMGFQGTDGFSVYGDLGRLVFRVDNYARRQKCLTKEIVLMDGDGKPLLCLKPRILSLHDRWNAYKIEECRKKQSNSKLFSVIKRHSVLQNAEKAEVLLKNLSSDDKKLKLTPSFMIEGSFDKRDCKIYNSSGEEVAQISRKKAGDAASMLLGNDVFSLTIRPGFDCKLVMAFVIVMDRIC